jgi:tetratricopeptide (TPR) repeat protein
MPVRPEQSRRSFAGALVAAAAALAACAPVRERPAPVAAPAPQITEAQLRNRAQENLALGLRQYQLGTYDEAQRSLTASLDHGLLSKTEQSTARKHLAFIHCISEREPQCRDEFRKALEIDPGFDLAPAEAGHPIWGPVYRDVRAQLAAATAQPAPVKTKGPRSVAEQFFDKGMAQYEAGDFEAAVKLLQAAVREGLPAKADQVKALKHSAFSLCLLKRYRSCRDEFIKIFEVDPDFDLTAAEAGHPSWTRTYASAKRRARAAREEAAKNAGAKR